MSRNGALAVLWGGVGALLGGWMMPLEPSLLEEGGVFHVAERVLQGEHLYRDLAFFSGPFPFHFLAVLLKLFGVEITVGRWAIVLLHGLACGCIFDLARRARAGPLAHAAAASVAAAPVLLFPLLSIYFYSTLVLHLCSLAAYSALRGLETPRWALLSGVLTAFAALSKQNVGLVLAIGLTLAIWQSCAPGQRTRPLRAYLLGGAAVAVATLSWFSLRGDLGAMVHALVVMPLSLGDSFSVGYVNLWPLGEFTPEVRDLQTYYVPHVYNMLTGQTGEIGPAVTALTQGLYALPGLALLSLGAARVFTGPLPPATWMLGVSFIALAANLFPRSDWGHLVFVIPPAVALFWVTFPGLRNPRVEMVASGIWVLVIFMAAASVGQRLHGISTEPNFGPRIPLRPVSMINQNTAAPRVIDFLRRNTEPGDPIFVARAEPLIYFASQTRNPTPYLGILPGARQEQEAVITSALASVQYVVMSEIDQPLFLYYSDELPAVQRYLERYFDVAAPFRSRMDWILVLQRAQDRGPSVLDLVDEAPRARRFARDAEGNEKPPPGPTPKLASRFNRRLLPVVLGPGGGGIDYELEVPRDAVLQVDVGLKIARELGAKRHHTKNVKMQIAIRSGDAFESLKTVDVVGPKRPGLNWTPVEIDLRPYAEKHVTLRLETISDRDLGVGRLVWWGSPRLARVAGSRHGAAH